MWNSPETIVSGLFSVTDEHGKRKKSTERKLSHGYTQICRKNQQFPVKNHGFLYEITKITS